MDDLLPLLDVRMIRDGHVTEMMRSNRQRIGLRPESLWFGGWKYSSFEMVFIAGADVGIRHR